MSKKLSSFAKGITIEPSYLLYYSVYIIIDTTNTNLMLQKKCRFSKASEPDLNTPCDDEKLGIRLVTEVNSLCRFITLLFCSCYSIFAASWSDSAGRRRRPLIFLPIIGQIFQAMCGCLNSYFWSWSPLTAAILNAVSEMITGGVPLFVVGVQTYICDVSSIENRTMRMGIMLAVGMLSELVGNGGSGFILRAVGFFYTYLTCFVLAITSLILAATFIKDTSVPVDKKSSFGRILNLFKIGNGFKIVFKKSLGSKRVLVLILLIVYTTMHLTTGGERGILYLYLRHKFHWDEREFSSYVFYRYIGVILGSIFCSVVLSKRLQIHDGLIGAFAGTCDTLAALGYIFADQNWHLYIVPLFDVFHGAASSVGFSFMSKFYDSSEIGRLSSVLGVFMLIFPVGYPLYNGVFNATLDIFPSAYFLLSVSLNTAVVLLYCVTYLLSRRLEKREEAKKSAIEEEKSKMIN